MSITIAGRLGEGRYAERLALFLGIEAVASWASFVFGELGVKRGGGGGGFVRISTREWKFFAILYWFHIFLGQFFYWEIHWTVFWNFSLFLKRWKEFDGFGKVGGDFFHSTSGFFRKL